MTPEEIPQEWLDLLDQRAGKTHSRTGSVASALAEIQTAYEEHARRAGLDAACERVVRQAYAEAARDRNEGREPDGLHVAYEIELVRLRNEQGRIRVAVVAASDAITVILREGGAWKIAFAEVRDQLDRLAGRRPWKLGDPPRPPVTADWPRYGRQPTEQEQDEIEEAAAAARAEAGEVDRRVDET
jgi:hypothetical protein